MAAATKTNAAATPDAATPDASDVAAFKAPTPHESARRSRPKLLPLADGYVVGGIALATLRSIGWFAGLFLAFALVQAARNISASELTFAIAAESLALQLPRIVLFTIPASLLYGTVATFSEMSARGEVAALMCGGMSLWRMLRWPLVFSLALTLFAFWLQEVVVPDFELRKSNLTARVAASILDNQKFKPLITYGDDGTPERIVQAEKFDVHTKTIIKPVIQIFRADGLVSSEIRARSASWDSAQQAWIFREGSTRSFKNPNDKDNLTTTLSDFPTTVITTDQMPNPDSFDAGEKSARDQIERKNYEMVSWRQLDAYRAEQIAQLPTLSGKPQKAMRKEIRRETYGIHDKFATPLVAIAMLLIGAPLGVRPQRTASAGLAMGISLMVILGYYLFWTLCTQWGKGGGQMPVVAAYLPVAVLSAIGVVLLIRKGR